MKMHLNDPPREYQCGSGPPVTMKDCGQVDLQADEQITLRTPTGGEYDVARKSWGFYATPSINGRLQRFNLRTALVKNQRSQYFVMLVEQGQEADFESYVRDESLVVCGWLHDGTLGVVESALADSATAQCPQS